MGKVEALREAMADFLAPELREINAKLASIEKRQDRDFDLLMKAIEAAKLEILLKVQMAQMAEKMAEQERVIDTLQKRLQSPQ